MRFCTKAHAQAFFAGKTVALVGSGPGSLANPRGFVDSHNVVTRVNNHKLFPATGYRTDCHFSFYGTSIKKTAEELKREGVKLCVAKCPDAQFMHSDWHARNGKMNGVDFSYIYRNRKDWWFCDTYVPTVAEFMELFELLNRHIPTTGFAALLFILSCNPKHVYMTGYDFFQSGIHNVNEGWKAGRPDDPIGHDPAAERAWFINNATALPITMDAALTASLAGEWKAPKVNQKRRGRRGRKSSARVLYPMQAAT